jgi:amino acid transporter
MRRFLRPTLLHGLLIVIGGIAFAFFGCLGAISGLTSNSPNELQTIGIIVGGLGFVAGLIAALTGGILLVIAIFTAIFGKRDAGQYTGDAPQ